ncbi:unnamed protein product [Caenorhabditis auriculariae]|uniref:Uncharacterized protein n=1 Tax=Caenorhabditis auriculariae TaxID=2777116 RepID=A0A8S1HHB8_9PELO|nr:unnamed protein product [Caenorhabditis auriculariae]
MRNHLIQAIFYLQDGLQNLLFDESAPRWQKNIARWMVIVFCLLILWLFAAIMRLITNTDRDGYITTWPASTTPAEEENSGETNLKVSKVLSSSGKVALYGGVELYFLRFSFLHLNPMTTKVMETSTKEYLSIWEPPRSIGNRSKNNYAIYHLAPLAPNPGCFYRLFCFWRPVKKAAWTTESSKDPPYRNMLKSDRRNTEPIFLPVILPPNMLPPS